MYIGEIGPSAILSLLTAIGVLFATYFNFKKLSDNIKLEERWRTTIDMKLEMISTDVKLIRGLETINQELMNRMSIVENNLSAAFKHIDKNRLDIDKLLHRKFSNKSEET